ncbi:hybrid sensor histidine kinase/response regulator [Candidatus Halobeggiatoa sp. HSG11]|nr:hybrid sensor histidine kinase/response regulator [Candidatus Halobeggiatoa sp. HSG11]
MNIKNSTLLVVDDVPANLMMLCTFLNNTGFQVNIAESGEDALEQINYTIPDLILLDIMMPGIDGFETCKRLKDNKKTQDIPIIFMTALSDTVDKIKGFEIGAVDYVTKPVQQEELLARITTHLTLRAQQKILKQQNNELEAFAHTVAHDLKNPLGAVISLNNALLESLDEWPKKKIYETVEIMDMAGNKMFNIINSLLLLSSTRSKSVVMKPIDMAQIVNDVEKNMVSLIKEHQGQIIMPTSWPTAKGYADWIWEVWANYISNGLKYGGQPPQLELGATPENNGYIKFWIRDNGIGLSAEEQKKLFVPFTRISQARIDGHGLGLSIVRRIVEKCGGKVGVESQKQKGSIFYFTLPDDSI